MRKVWVVVANSSLSKIYRAENTHTLVEHQLFEHKESQMPARALVSDRQGRETQRVGYGTDTMEEKTPIKQKEAQIFAEQIADFLKRGCISGECERIYLVAKPPFLGFLRQALDPNISKHVENEIHHDLTQKKPEQVREYLPPAL